MQIILMSAPNSVCSEMPPLQQQVAESAGSSGSLTTALNASSVTSDSGIDSSGASSSSSGASNSNASSTKSPHITNNNNSTATSSDCVSVTTNNNNNNNNNNNTVSAPADSSDNQPSTPQPKNDVLQQQQPILHQPYAGALHESTQQHQHMYASGNTNSSSSVMPHMYQTGMYASEQHLQQQQQQQQNYGNFMHNFDPYYHHHQQQQQQPTHFINNATNSAPLMFNTTNSNNVGDYKSSSVRYHPYMLPTIDGTPTVADLSNDNNSKHIPPTLANNNAISNTRVMSPSMVSSSSPTSTSVHMNFGSGVSGTPNSPSGSKRQCKKCGIMCSSESEMQEHVSNVHGSSPYGSSSGYSSSPFIKEESGINNNNNITATSSANAGDILDLDSQKMVYPHELEASHLQQPSDLHEDPLHSMHTMQQRALPAWEQTPTMTPDGVPGYYASKQNTLTHFAGEIKQEFKSEFPDSQHFVDNGNGTDVTQQPNPPSTLPISSSPAEFPSTTTADVSQDQQQQQQQQFRNFEPPTSSSSLPTNSITTKAATWKSNEARRPKTYNCTACNKWFTSSGHLKRHYNTTLHKNAVKSSNQPDPATLPISAHHHPARDPNSKHNRRNSQQQQQAAQSQQAPATIVPSNDTPGSPTDYVSIKGAGPLSHYSASPSPTQNGYQQQFMQQTNNLSPRLSGIASPTTSNGSSSNNNNNSVLNGHPNALAGPSVPITPPPGTTVPTTMSSSQTRGLLNTSTTTTTTTINLSKNETNTEEDATVDTSMGVVNMEQEQHLVSMQQQSEHMEQEQQHQQMLLAQEQEHQGQEQLVQYHNISSLASNNNNNSNRITSPHIICHQAYLEEQQQQQMVDNSIYSRTTPTSPQQQQQQQLVHLPTLPPAHSIMEQQRVYNNIMHLDINTNNMPPYITHTVTTAARPMEGMVMQQQQQQQQRQARVEVVGEQRVTVKLEAMEMDMEEQQEQQVEHLQHRLLSMPQCHTLLNNTSLEVLDNMLTQPHTHINMQQQQHMPHIINTHTTPTMLPPTTITSQQLQPHTTNITTIPCFQQLQHQAVGSVSASESPALVPLEPTMTYHTIIGNAARYTQHNNNNNNNNSSNNDNTIEQQIATTTTTTTAAAAAAASAISGDYLQLTSNNHTFDNYAGMQQQIITTSDGQILQLIPAHATAQFHVTQTPYFTLSQYTNNNNNNNNNEHVSSYDGSTMRQYAPISTRSARRSPQEADLPPSTTNTQESAVQRTYSPTITSSSSSSINNNVSCLQSYAIVDINDTVNKRKLDEHDNGVSSTPKLVTVKRRRSNNATINNFRKVIGLENQQHQQQELPAFATTLPSGRIKCVECDKEFTKICYLTQHNKSFHSGEYPYRCEKCGKRFQAEDIYKAHSARHKSQDKPHKCEICPKQFHHKTDLRRHIEAIHTGLKQHICEICEKGFCRKDHLRKHIETHSRPRVSGASGFRKPKGCIKPKNVKKKFERSSSPASANINFDNCLISDKNSLNVVGNIDNLTMHMQQQQQQQQQEQEQQQQEQEEYASLVRDTDTIEDDSHLLLDDEDEDEEELVQMHQPQLQTPQQQQQQQQQYRINEIALF